MPDPLFTIVTAHRTTVRSLGLALIGAFRSALTNHDLSKLSEPERSTFETFAPRLATCDYGSAEYKRNLQEMKPGLIAHYANNRHHPEHFESGVSGMNLVDLMEMLCDWAAAAMAKEEPVPLTKLFDRFGIQPQVQDLVINTYDLLHVDYTLEESTNI